MILLLKADFHAAFLPNWFFIIGFIPCWLVQTESYYNNYIQRSYSFEIKQAPRLKRSCCSPFPHHTSLLLTYPKCFVVINTVITFFSSFTFSSTRIAFSESLGGPLLWVRLDLKEISSNTQRFYCCDFATYCLVNIEIDSFSLSQALRHCLLTWSCSSTSSRYCLLMIILCLSFVVLSD